MFLSFLRTFLQWLGGFSLERLFYLIALVSITAVSWSLGRSLIRADGRINYCYTESGTQHSGLTVIPTVKVYGHRDWKFDILLGEFVFNEQAVEAMQAMPVCH